MGLQLTKGQEQAIKVAVQRYKNKEPYTVIAGYAGVGKTFVIKYIIDALKISEDQVAYIAFTGKAALNLRNKGCPDAMTAHRLLYFAKEKPDGSFDFQPRVQFEKQYRLIVVDEVSMIPEDMWALLLSHGIHIIALGDPEQLPPVDGLSTILDEPHVFLDEIVRQALDNPIIRLSMDIRMGNQLKSDGDKQVRIIPYSKVSKGLLLGADIVICGLNATRHALNKKMRMLRWEDEYQDKPLNGDKVICLKNQWNTLSSTGDSLINGTLGTIENVNLFTSKLFNPGIKADFTSDDNGVFSELFMDYKLITTGEPTVNKDNFMDYPKKFRPKEFAYGYAITCHKSQGSEFDRVIVYDEPFGDDRQKRRWRYTAVTRAAKQLVIVV